MGYPLTYNKLMDAVNARQGQTLTREQLAKITGLSNEQVGSGMRTLIGKAGGRIEVVVQARAWRMIPDSKLAVPAPKATPTPAKTAPAAEKPAPAPKAQLLAEKPVEAPKESVAVKAELLVLEVLGVASDGNKIARDTKGKLWGLRAL